jgi:NADH-quinone oxidoreductase subunit A
MGRTARASEPEVSVGADWFDRLRFADFTVNCEPDMPDAVTSSLGIVAYLALFAMVGVVFLLVNLLVGRLVRPQNPHPEKLEIYECGEPAVGTSFVQFDLRFYVVALLFIVFDVEVAFFFPWATVFGKAVHLARLKAPDQVVVQADEGLQLTERAESIYRELGIQQPGIPRDVVPSLAASVNAVTPQPQRTADIVRYGGRQLALVTLVDIAVFFAVLLVGFAYVWNRGDLNWVRAYRHGDTAEGEPGAGPETLDLEQALSA